MEPNIPSQRTPTPEAQPLATQPVQTRTNNSSSKRKFILIVVLVLLVLFAVGGAYYLGVKNQSSSQNSTQVTVTIKPPPTLTPVPTIQPSPASTTDLTANWKTYTSSEGRFLLKYPSNFELHINESHVFETTTYSPAKNHIELNSPTAGVIPFIMVDYQTSNDSLNQFITKNSNCTSIISTGGSEILISGITGKLYANTPCGVAGDTEAFIVNNGLGYIITFQGSVDKVFLNEFLSSFSFIK